MCVRFNAIIRANWLQHHFSVIYWLNIESVVLKRAHVPYPYRRHRKQLGHIASSFLGTKRCICCPDRGGRPERSSVGAALGTSAQKMMKRKRIGKSYATSPSLASQVSPNADAVSTEFSCSMRTDNQLGQQP